MNGEQAAHDGREQIAGVPQEAVDAALAALDRESRGGDACARSILRDRASGDPTWTKRMMFWYAELAPEPVFADPGPWHPFGTDPAPVAAPSVTFSPDQERALAAVLARLTSKDPATQTTVLTGPAGSGKTTILREILARCDAASLKVAMFAPTGKAALRMREATGRSARTVHSGLYRRVCEDEEGRPVFSEPDQLGDGADVVVVDEGSMVGTRVADDIRANLKGARLLVVGDGAQIPPVKDSWGFPMLNPHAELTTVHRQALESPILAFATETRQGRGWAFLEDWLQRGQPDNRLCVCSGTTATVAHALGDLAQRLPDGHVDPDDAAAITWTNANRRAINEGCRAALAPASARWFDTGMPVLIRENKHDFGLLNGEVARVKDAEHGNTATRCRLNGEWPLFLVESMIYASSRDWSALMFPKGRGEQGPAYAKRAVRADPGYCLTVHASQGSQWPVVVFYADGFLLKRLRSGNEDARRLVYTAATRASERLVIVLGG
jgi:exodeoxyribonuclease V